MDFTNEINTLESEKLRLEEMLKRNNDRLQLLKEVSTKPSSDGYRRFFKLKGYSLLYTGGKCLNSDYFVFNCTLISTAGHLSRRCWNVEEPKKGRVFLYKTIFKGYGLNKIIDGNEWKYIIKYKKATQWLYIDDLLPKKGD